MEFDMEITNSNGDVYYNTTDAVIVDQANGWRDLTPELRRRLARRGFESLSQSLAIDYLSDAIVEGDCDTLRGTKGRTYASMVRRGLDLEIDDTLNRSGTAFELDVGYAQRLAEYPRHGCAEGVDDGTAASHLRRRRTFP